MDHGQHYGGWTEVDHVAPLDPLQVARRDMHAFIGSDLLPLVPARFTTLRPQVEVLILRGERGRGCFYGPDDKRGCLPFQSGRQKRGNE